MARDSRPKHTNSAKFAWLTLCRAGTVHILRSQPRIPLSTYAHSVLSLNIDWAKSNLTLQSLEMLKCLDWLRTGEGWKRSQLEQAQVLDLMIMIAGTQYTAAPDRMPPLAHSQWQ